MQTLLHLLRESTERDPERVALSMRTGLRADRWSYARLWGSAHSVAADLRQRGVACGDRVLVWAPNSPQLVAAYFSCMLAGAIVVPLDLRTPTDLLQRIRQRSEAGFLISALPVPPELADVPAVQLGDLDFSGTGDGVDLSTLQPSDVWEIVFTSGTTGNPKGVTVTHENILANVHAIAQVIPPSPDYRLLSILPLSHLLEQVCGLYFPLYCGASIYFPATRQSSVVFAALRQNRITNMVVVPQTLDLFLRAIEREVRSQGQERRWHWLQRLAPLLPIWARRILFARLHRNLGGHLRYFICGGAYLLPALQEAWERLGVLVLQGYGCTECTPIISSNTLTSRVPGSVGRPVADVAVRLAEDGEILVKGRNVTSGYWQDSAATAAAFEGDWYRTGDLAEMDARGNLFLKGRKKDLIVLPNGQNVYPEDIEQGLRQQPGVRDCVVLEEKLAGGARRLHAVLLPEPGVQLDTAGVLRLVNQRLAPHQQLGACTLWSGEDFPRTHTLKVKRAEVAAALAEQRSEAPPSLPPPGARASDMKAQLSGLLAELCRVPCEGLRPETELAAELGMDSLLRVELTALLEQELGIEADEAAVAELATVQDLMNLVEQEARRPPTYTMPDWARGPLSRKLREALQSALLFPLLRLWCTPLRIEGREHLKNLFLPALFYANHSSHFDTPVLLSALPSRIRRHLTVAAAADYFYRGRALGFATSLLLNTFPFDRQRAVHTSLQRSGELIDEGWSLLVYPEGTRSLDGRLQPFKLGIGLLASELGAPIVPVRLEGLHDVLPKGRRWPRRGPVRVRFGPPLPPPQNSDHQAIARSLEAALVELSLPE